MVLPEEVDGAGGHPAAPPAPTNGEGGNDPIPPPAPPGGSGSAGTVVGTETPVAGMSIEGLASILVPMLAQQLDITKPTGTTNGIYSTAITEQYATDRMMSSLISLSGMQSEITPRPEYFEMTVRAREAALEKAVRGISKLDDEDDSDDDEGRGMGASAELPVGVPMWPPTVFLARDRKYTQPWHREMLGQGDTHFKEGDSRLAEGETMSNIMIWLDFAVITNTLLEAAIASQNWAVVPSLIQQTSAYTKAAYSAGRARTDGVTMRLLGKDAAQLYARNRTMSLGSTNMDRRPAEFIQSLNKQTQIAAAKAIANKIANSKYDDSTPTNADGDAGALTGRDKKRAERAAKLKKAKEDGAKVQDLSDKKIKTTPKGGPQVSATDPAKNAGGSGAPKGK